MDDIIEILSAKSVQCKSETDFYYYFTTVDLIYKKIKDLHPDKINYL